MTQVITSEERPRQAAVPSSSKSVIVRIAQRYGVDERNMLATLKATAFRQRAKDGQPPVEVSDAQMMALLVVSDQHGLNPFLKEIYAFPSEQGIVPIVGVDGWHRIINSHPQFDGIEFEDVGELRERTGKDKWKRDVTRVCPDGITCKIYRKDREHPIVVTEYYDECFRDKSDPWATMPRRMLRWKAEIQCARVAFSFAGIYDEDEGRDIIDGGVARVVDEGADTGRRAAASDLLNPAAQGAAPKAERVDEVVIESEPAPEIQGEGPGEAAEEGIADEICLGLLEQIRQAASHDALSAIADDAESIRQDLSEAQRGIIDTALRNRATALAEPQGGKK